ncbi:alpha-1,2-fucosyltransferase [Candidatus Parcubacteria bacterium]|nr:alpha-1,2-fucosyltransferase [Candidatus Parcubacteria bacterium]
MLTTNLKGGLGNQMFQYATGRYISVKSGVELYLDTNWFFKKDILNSDTKRKFELDKFNIKGQISDPDQARKIKYPYGSLSKILSKFEKKFLDKYYLDYHPQLLKEIQEKLKKDPNTNIYLNGFFQSEKNFAEIRPLLLQEFQLKPEFITQKVKEFEKQIENNNSVSIHIRRGDYAQNPKTLKIHGLCPISYYRDAIDLIIKTVENPHFFIFTDDVAWAKENLKISDPHTFVSGNDLSGPQELWLMSKCQHNIIANSSFSWWGAWLNQNPTKHVIAPEKWTVKNNEHPNIIAEGWITL